MGRLRFRKGFSVATNQSEGGNGLLNSLRVCWWNGPFCWLVEWTVLLVGGMDRCRGGWL